MNLIVTIYLWAISIISLVVTVVDKHRAVTGNSRNRIPERTLITLSMLGGSVAMLLTMYIIRHKTQKPKFMLGIPIIIALQIGIIYLLNRQGVVL